MDNPLLIAALMLQLFLTVIMFTGGGALVFFRSQPGGDLMQDYQRLLDRVNAQQAEIAVVREALGDYAAALLDAQLAIRRMVDECRESGVEPPHVANYDTQTLQRIQTRLELFDKLARYFSLDDLAELAMSVFGVAVDELPGRTRREFAYELIAYAERRGRLDELLQAAAAARPHVSF